MNDHELLLEQVRGFLKLDETLPGFFYSTEVINRRAALLRRAMGERFQILFSVKANPYPPILKILAAHKLAADISSGGELKIALANGFDSDRISFCGPGKTELELRAALAAGVQTIVVESLAELEAVESLAARMEVRAEVSLRVQPEKFISASGRTLIRQPSNFGLSEDQLPRAIEMARSLRQIRVTGLHVHLGSMYFRPDWLLSNMRKIAEIAAELREGLGYEFARINFGGGLAIPYKPGHEEFDLEKFAHGLGEMLREDLFQDFSTSTQFQMEAGRFLTGPAGAYVTRIVSKKASFDQTIVTVEGGMNHHLAAVGFGQALRAPLPMALLPKAPRAGREAVRLVGASCYGMDVLADQVELPICEVGDRVVIFQSGAYGPSFSPVDFLSRPRAHEVLL